ncbi:OLC1v1015876C1 [Oldenlandia corymbosa var. corymbosa]|uniref:OLC1v1015876C1 n=1 Tax=Oldenlandia corymbosa var. corymbosa TaxID=529605 RepID=A0AAV1E6E7_OLDCO|nr:OLC1v1015876C1 [Oldenlandia corymbosa var. corymbosa]
MHRSRKKVHNDDDHQDQKERYLPIEIQTEILRRLPVKSLARMKSVCKPWCDLIPEYPPFVRVGGLIRHCFSEPLRKVLTNSDLSWYNKRLALVPRDSVTRLLLPMLEPKDGDISKGISVLTYDWLGNKFPMRFTVWNLGTRVQMHVLVGGWYGLCYKHSKTMTVGDRLIVRMFRDPSDGICFALSLVKSGREDQLLANQNNNRR